MKKFTVTSAIFTLAACLLIGCQGASSTTSTSQNRGDLVLDDNGDIVYSNVKLKMWSVTTGDDANTQDKIIAQFNEMYKGMIEVETTHTSRYDLETLLTSTMEFEPQNAPDLFFSHGSRANEYVEKDWLLPIEEIMEVAGLAIDREDYVESLLDSTTVNQKVYGLPQDVHSAMIVVRKDILEKNNLTIPTNYQELVSTCENAIAKAKKGELWIRGTNSEGYATTEWRKAKSNENYYPFPIAYGDMWVHEFLGYTAALQNGGSLVAEDGKPAWNSSQTANGLQILRDWIFPGQTSTNTAPLSLDYGSEYDVGNVPLKAGSALFKLLGPWEYQRDLAEYDRDFKNDQGSNNLTTLSLSNLFAKDSSKEYASKIKGEGHAFMVMSTVESMTKQCASMVFADYMVNNAGVEWAKRGHLPSLKSVENSAEYRDDPAYDAYISKWGSCDDYVVVPPTPYYGYVDTYFKNVLQKTMAKSYQTTTIATLLKTEYEDCIDYIDLFA